MANTGTGPGRQPWPSSHHGISFANVGRPHQNAFDVSVWRPPEPMSLRLKISLLVCTVAALLAFALVAWHVTTIRISVHEEIETARRVANQALLRVSEVRADGGAADMLTFLRQLGRLRAIDIELLGADGKSMYQSPKSKYKAGRFAPAWFAQLIAPPVQTNVISLHDGSLAVHTEPSRAALDGWEQTVHLFWLLTVGFMLLGVTCYWFIGRAMRPITEIISGLRRIGNGEYDTRLPTYGLAEADAIGQSFNQMAQDINDNLDARAAAVRSATELASNRKLTRELERRTEQVNAELSRELHDELGQHVTAIKSMGISIGRRIDQSDDAISKASGLIVESADKIHLAVRSMLQRLVPVSLAQFGLADAVQDMVSDLRLQHPDIQFGVDIGGPIAQLPEPIARTGFRIVQEALTNAIRHAQPDRVEARMQISDGQLVIQVDDDGVGGLSDESIGQSGFGLPGMRVRAQDIGGSLTISNSSLGGVSIVACLPCSNEPVGST